MNGLMTSRVVIIDDDPSEAAVLLGSLGRVGVGAIWSSGQPGELPAAPINGIRLVFLDLHLLNSGSAESIIRTTVEALGKIVNVKSPGIGLVLWTKHPEDMDAFAVALKEQFKDFAPRFVVFQEKLKYLSDPTELPKLLLDIQNTLAQSPGFQLLLDWEQFVNNAAASSGDQITTLAAGDDQIVDAAAALVRASGATCSTETDTLMSFFESMNALLADQVSNASLPAGNIPVHLTSLHKRHQDEFELSREHVAGINRALLSATVAEGKTGVVQGNLYFGDSWEVTQTNFPSPTAEDAVRAELYTAFPYTGERTDKEKGKAWKKRISELARHCRPCALEISPACDLTNGKAVFARLLGGILIPDDEIQPVLKLSASARMFAKDLPVMQFDLPKYNFSGRYSLILNARHLVTVRVESLMKVQPVARIREAAIIDVQAWFGGHAARPGFVALY